MAVDRTVASVSGPLGALAAAGPHPAHADKLMLFGQFVGSWDVDAVKISRDGARTHLRGEWHFDWVLEGRAIQDVLISPPRPERAGDAWVEGDYGTTIRFYDPRLDAWQIRWITPPYGEIHDLVGRQVGDEIVLEGQAPDGTLERWVFSDVTRDAFRWHGELSSDGGRTWFRDEEMTVRRRG